ncbi:kinase-like domain-containing protein [Aspergillus karnatakaensis]|uniref:kinase-like domain-containing protein n=1 Tax=Aspergillus karnatakaensis TaxID=1810916 RepID=UPI003CCCA08D
MGDACIGAIGRGWPLLWSRHRDSRISSSTSEDHLLESDSVSDSPSLEHLPFADQYGSCLTILHYGFNSTIRLHQGASGSNRAQLFAVKVYSRNHWSFLGLRDNRQSCSAHAIAQCHPAHPHILPITNLLTNRRSQLCLVMPYCGGKNLHDLVVSKCNLAAREIDRITMRVLQALAFLHERSMAHHDVRLESVMLTEEGVVQLGGFSDAYIHRLWTDCALPDEPDNTVAETPAPPWSFSSLLSLFSNPPRVSPRSFQIDEFIPSASFPGIRLPYMAPESFRSGLHSWYHENDNHIDKLQHKDPRPADIWGVGIIYLTLLSGHLPWRCARPAPEDPKYLAYLCCREGEKGAYPWIGALDNRQQSAVYAMLDPDPERRITAEEMLDSDWGTGSAGYRMGDIRLACQG